MCTALSPAARPPARLFPVTAGARLLLTEQVWGYRIPSLSGTEGMCVARLGGGGFKQTALAPASAESHHPRPPHNPPDRGGSLDRVTRSQEPAEFI